MCILIFGQSRIQAPSQLQMEKAKPVVPQLVYHFTSHLSKCLLSLAQNR